MSDLNTVANDDDVIRPLYIMLPLVSVFIKQRYYHKGIPLHYLRKICKSLPEYLICQGALSLPSNYNPDHVNIPHKRAIF